MDVQTLAVFALAAFAVGGLLWVFVYPILSGERKTEKEEKDKSFYLHERLEKQFERRFTLPADVDTAKIDAMFRTGVLEVHIPKIERAKARTIEIKA